MYIDQLRDFCLLLPRVTEDFPFDASTLTFRVEGKIFVLCDIDTFDFINVKCNPENIVEWREQYEEVKPGYHMNKSKWNSVYMNRNLSDTIIFEMIKHSYYEVCISLPKKIHVVLLEELKNLT